MDIDKRVENEMRHTTSPQEHRILMQTLNMRRKEPVVQLSLAMFRDSLVFRDMSNSMIYDLSCSVAGLKKQVAELNERLDKALE